MDNPAYMVILPGLAVALDLLLGDPQGFPHPVRGLGRIIETMEGWARQEPGHLRLKGVLAVAGLAMATAVAVWILCRIPILGYVAAVYLAYAGLGLGCLLRECRSVARLIDADQIMEARKALAMLVSRDVSELDALALRRTLAETLSENLSDAFSAPLFWLAVFGVPGLWAYKAVSTLDSMWGYRTEQYRLLGWASARADDLLAWIPAKLTWLALVCAGGLMGLPWERALLKTPGDARKMESPNAGWPMAAAAWLCGARMGGTAVYFGEKKHKPELGPLGEWSAESIQLLLRATLIAGLVFAVGVQIAVVV